MQSEMTATEHATMDIIRVLTSHNPRLRPRYDRFDIRISCRPCSDIDFIDDIPEARGRENLPRRKTEGVSSPIIPEFHEQISHPSSSTANLELIIGRDTTAIFRERTRSRSPSPLSSEKPVCCRQLQSTAASAIPSSLPCTTNRNLHSSPPRLLACPADAASSRHASVAHPDCQPTTSQRQFSSSNGGRIDRQSSNSVPLVLSSRAPCAAEGVPRRRRRLWDRLLGCLGASRAAAAD